MFQRLSFRSVRAGTGCASLAVVALCLSAAAAGAQTQSSSSSASASASAAAKAPAPAATNKPAAPATPPADAAAKPAPANGGGGEGPGDETTITITADKPEVVHKADRDVYDVKQDPTAATGAAADVLNNIPNVAVDPDGTVALRGNQNVQVYINGKKTSQTQGDARAFTLQTLAGADIDSVEVMTNPPASFGSDSSGGIINIVLKRGKSLQPTRAVTVTVGDSGKAGVGLQTGKAWGKFTLSATLAYNQNGGGGGGGGGFGGGGGGGNVKSHSTGDQFRLDPTTGNVLSERQTDNISRNRSQNYSIRLAGNYNLTDSDTLTGEMGYNRRTGTTRSEQHVRSFDPTHVLTGEQTQFSRFSRPSDDVTFNLNYDHRGEIGTSNGFKMQWQHTKSWSSNPNETRTVFQTPTRVDTLSSRHDKSSNSVDEFSGDWSRELNETDGQRTQLQLGWDLTTTIDERFTYASLTHDTGTPEVANPNGVKQFNDEQNLFAVYAIYEQQFGKLSLQGGLRFEDLKETIYSETPLLGLPAATATHDSVNWSPSLFALYKLTDNDQFRFNYSKKLNRPRGQQLDPLIILSADGLFARSGNPNLKPERTDKYELTYNHDIRNQNQGQQAQGQPQAQSTAMRWTYGMGVNYSSATGTITQVQTFLPGGQNVLLTTYQNAGSSDVYGGTLNLNGQAGRVFGVGFNYYYSYRTTHFIDINTHQMVTRHGPQSGGGFNVRYRMDDKNSFNMRVNYTGVQVDDLSRRSGTTNMTVSYTRQIVPSKFVLTVNASNVLQSQGRKTFNESSVSRSFNETFDPGASLMVNLRYNFGKVISRGQRGQGQGGFRNGQGGGGQGGGRGGFGGGQGGGGGGRGF